jgi:hypothetical protein
MHEYMRDEMQVAMPSAQETLRPFHAFLSAPGASHERVLPQVKALKVLRTMLHLLTSIQRSLSAIMEVFMLILVCHELVICQQAYMDQCMHTCAD